jgi:hypothetical protein
MIKRVVDSGKMRCIAAASSLELTRLGETGSLRCACVISLSSFLMYLYCRYSCYPSASLGQVCMSPTKHTLDCAGILRCSAKSGREASIASVHSATRGSRFV